MTWPKPSTRSASPNASAGHPPPYNESSASCRGDCTDDPMTRLFGTDGIRGVANDEPLTPELAFRVGRSEERRVGKEGRARGRTYETEKKGGRHAYRCR